MECIKHSILDNILCVHLVLFLFFEGLGSTVLALQAIFFTILVVVAISLLIMMRYNEEDCKNCGISLLIAYFLSGKYSYFLFIIISFSNLFDKKVLRYLIWFASKTHKRQQPN